MKITFIFFLFKLFVNGVFSDGGQKEVSLSVMEGDSVTLYTNLTHLWSNDVVVWRFYGIIIAKVDRETNSSPYDFERNFRNRLAINNQTGDITIKKIRAEDSGPYQLIVTGNTELANTFIISCVNDSAAGVKLVSVMIGDSVTLHVGVTDTQTDDIIEWRFGPKRALIATDNKSGTHINFTGIQDRLYWNHQRGDLTIRHIRNDTSGLYEVQITRRSKSYTITKRFNVTISERLNRKSIKEGQPVNLFSGLNETHTDDVILWWFEHGDSPIAKIDRKAGIFLIYDNVLNGRFSGRLKLDNKSGNLTITNTKKEDSGLYHVDSSSSTHTKFTRYAVTVCGQDLFSGTPILVTYFLGIVIVVAVAVAVTVGVAIHYSKKFQQMKNDPSRGIESREMTPLNQEQQ